MYMFMCVCIYIYIYIHLLNSFLTTLTPNRDKLYKHRSVTTQ